MRPKECHKETIEGIIWKSAINGDVINDIKDTAVNNVAASSVSRMFLRVPTNMANDSIGGRHVGV